MVTALPGGPALVVRGPGVFGLEDRTAVAPGPGEVRITPLFVGVCGTDLEIIDGRMDPDYVRYPLVIGHEWSGVVAATGDRADRFRAGRFQAGDTVVVEGIIPDGVCAACRAGRTNLCAVYDELGFMRDGAAGPSVTVPERLVHRLGPGIPAEAGALVEPLSVVLRGLLEANPERGGRMLVIGDGTVALLAAHALRLWSPSEVVVSGRRPEQAGLARTMGADAFTVEPAPERSFDFVVEAAGNIDAVQSALTAPRRGGSVLLLGIAGHGRTITTAADDIVNNDLRIRGSFGYTAEAWRSAVALLNSGALTPLPLITHRFPLENFAEAVDALRHGAGDGPRGKILLTLDRRASTS
ncbi:dehydrogenase [Actinoplanes sp. NBRC 103695]|nr:dehydrogenase [Actinoplanes sp. NBRC 103695]